ncbi:MAG: chemotaxis protein CheW [Candidatus Latescibacteria bacterium]|nr:chemotaxis protein CheW [bacterium]MBD3425167.1 chemotaxis protein CheW [Candidatus Latescibacterota bacterium]
MEDGKNLNETESLTYVCFNLGEELYGQDIRHINEITRIERITDMPGSPEYIMGVTNLRGRIVPVMDIRQRLGLDPITLNGKSRLIVVEHELSSLGLAVDLVHYVNRIPAERIQPPPEQAKSDRNRFLKGIIFHEGELLYLIDVMKIYQAEQSRMVDV